MFCRSKVLAHLWKMLGVQKSFCVFVFIKCFVGKVENYLWATATFIAAFGMKIFLCFEELFTLINKTTSIIEGCWCLSQCCDLNIFYSDETDWAWHKTRQCPLCSSVIESQCITLKLPGLAAVVISDSYCSLKPLWSGMRDVVPARTSPPLHPPSPPTVLWLPCLKVSQCINCRD